jgi:hypothetical protein
MTTNGADINVTPSIRNLHFCSVFQVYFVLNIGNTFSIIVDNDAVIFDKVMFNK